MPSFGSTERLVTMPAMTPLIAPTRTNSLAVL